MNITREVIYVKGPLIKKKRKKSHTNARDYASCKLPEKKGVE